MDPVSAGIIGVAGLAGGAMANSSNADNTRAANEASLQSAREQMAFQERMSNTSYQRAMADMKAAGLNPMLAYMKGGADTPGGSSITAQAAKAENIVGPAISNAMQAGQIKVQTDVAKSQAEMNAAMSATQQTIQAKNIADTAVSAKAADKIQTETNLLKKGEPRAELQNRVEGFILKKIKDAGEWSAKHADDLKNRMDNIIKKAPRLLP